MKPRPYEKIFTPGAPVKAREYLFGRDQELADLARAVRRPGLHPIVVGHRGVGKTSLVYQAFRDIDPHPITVGCNPAITFERIGVEVLKALGLDVSETERSREVSKEVEGGATPFGIGVKASGSQKDTIKHRGLGADTVEPWLVYQRLREAPRRYLIILDEYDAIPSHAETVHAGVAYLIKTLADHAHECNSRLVIVGVAQSAQDLLGRHESVERSGREIFVRPLRSEDVADFLTIAERRLHFTFEPNVKSAIVDQSMGYPYFVHLVGLECLDAMYAHHPRARTVTEEDFRKALVRAVDHAFRSELRKFAPVVRGLLPVERVLVQELASYTRPPQRKQLESVVQRKTSITPEQFDHAWVRLQQELRLLYVSRNNDTIRFSDPLLGPFLRARFWKIPPHTGGKLPLFEHQEAEKEGHRGGEGCGGGT